MKTVEELANKESLTVVTDDQIRKFYIDNFGEAIPKEDEESIFWAWTKSRKMVVISWISYGYKSGKQAAARVASEVIKNENS